MEENNLTYECFPATFCVGYAEDEQISQTYILKYSKDGYSRHIVSHKKGGKAPMSAVVDLVEYYMDYTNDECVYDENDSFLVQ